MVRLSQAGSPYLEFGLAESAKRLADFEIIQFITG
jgi:hypothetical protein